MDGPPIHGNTRLEIIWTAIPAILLVALCSYAYVVADRHRGGRRRPALKVRVVGEQFTWTFYYRPDARARRSPRRSSTCRAAAGALHRPVQGRDPRLLGPGLPHEDRRRARDRHRTSASRRSGPASTPSSAPSCAGSATRPCARPPTSSSQADFDRWLAGARAGAGGGERGRRRRGRPAAASGRARRQGRLHRQRLRRLPHARGRRARPAAPGPTSTRASKGKDEAFIQQSIVDPTAEITKGFSDGIMPPNFGETLQPAELDALVKYLAEVTK